MKARGLQKSVIPLIVKSGLQQKADERVLPIDNFARLRNCYLEKLGRLKKMPGQTRLSRAVATGGTISSASGLTAFRNELLLYSNNEAYSYNEGARNWVTKGNVSTVQTSSRAIVRNTQQQTFPDATLNMGTLVFAWEDTAGGVYARSVDYTTSAVVAQDTLLRSGAVRPKTVSQGSVSLIFYAAGNTLYVRRYDRSGAPTTFGSEVALVSDLDGTNFLYDVCPMLNAVALVYRTNGGSVKIAYVTLSPALGNPINGFPSPQTIPQDASLAVAVWPQGSQQVMIGFSDAATGTFLAARTAATLDQSFAPVLAHAATDDVRNIGGVISSGQTSTVLMEIAGSLPQFNRVVKNTITETGVLGTETSVARSVGLLSKPFVSAGAVHAQMAFDTALQATTFIIREDGFILSRVNSGTAGGLNTRSGLAEVSTALSDVFLIPATVKSAFVTEGNVTFSRTGVIEYTHDFRVRQPTNLSTETGLYLLSGMAQTYDGVSFFEQGYHVYPEGMTFITAGGGSMGAGDYQYVFLWEWYDDQGQIHRSAPSIPQSVTVTANQQVTWTVPTLRLTARKGSRSAPILAAYRTQEIGANGGTLFLRVSSRITASSTNGIVFNDPNVDTITFIDQLADSSIVANEYVYTTGNVLENLPPEPCTTGVFYKGRIVLNTADQTGLSQYTKFAAPGEAPAFNPNLNIPIDVEGGDVTGYGVLDEKLIISKLDGKWVTYGEPASNTGINGSLVFPQRIADDGGVTHPVSIVRSEFGLLYRSLKGYYLLSRGLEDEFAGAAVEDFSSLTPSGAISSPTLQQIRFYHTDGECLVFDTFFKTWSTFAQRECTGATLWKGLPTIVNAIGEVRVEDGGSGLTNNSSYCSMAIETGWISLAQVQGFQRVWRLMILCRYVSPHKLLVRVATDFSDAWKQIVYVDPQTGLNTTPYGGEDYGQGMYGGQGDSSASNPSLDEVYQARIHIEPQKCQSIKFAIEDLQDGTNFGTGEGLQVNGFALEVGAKVGTFKPHAAKTFGGT
jgi:hypothetical protein